MAPSLPGFLRGTRNVQLGIDVGGSAVKVVALEKSSKGTTLLGLGWEETPTGTVIDGNINDIQAISQVVKSALEQTKIRYKGASASIGLRGINVVFKRITIPFQGIAELPRQVILEAQQHVDNDLSHWQIDYETIGTPNSEGQLSLLLVAAKKQLVNEHVEMLKKVGVLPSILDCDALAIINSFEYVSMATDKTVLCVDVGRDSTKIHLITAGKSNIIRSLPIGGAHFTDLIARNLNINHTEAETLKWSISDPDFSESHPEIKEICSQHTRELCEEIRKTFDFYADNPGQDSIKEIESIILSGGGAVAPGLSESISSLMNSEAIYATPFSRMNINPKINEVVTTKYSHQFAVAAGLALRTPGDKA